MTRRILIHIFVLYSAWCLVQACLPTTGGDPCRTVQYAPKWYLEHGFQYHAWFGVLQLHEILVMQIMRFIPDPGAVFSTLMMIGCGGMLWLIADRFWPRSKNGGILAALLYMTIPISRICSFYAMKEHTMVFLLLIGLLTVLEYSVRKKETWLITGGFLTGLACGVDINALIPAFLLILMSGHGFWLFGSAVLGGMMPFYVQNVIYFGNPVYPWHEDWFGWMNWGLKEDLCVDFGNMPGWEGTTTELLRTEAQPHADAFSWLVWGSVISVFWIKHRLKLVCKLGFFVVTMLIYWVFWEDMVHARYWMPVLAVMSLMGGIGVGYLTKGASDG
jgi:hypothetical protein